MRVGRVLAGIAAVALAAVVAIPFAPGVAEPASEHRASGDDGPCDPEDDPAASAVPLLGGRPVPEPGAPADPAAASAERTDGLANVRVYVASRGGPVEGATVRCVELVEPPAVPAAAVTATTPASGRVTLRVGPAGSTETASLIEVTAEGYLPR